jgi:DNA polymerase (family 10)
MPDKNEIINLLEKISDLLEFKGEDQFKVSAYRNAANSIRRNEKNIKQIIEANELNKVKGIGKSIASIIYEFYKTGSSSLYYQLKKEVPENIEKLFEIRGIGPKKIRLLNSELGISSINELEQACKEGRISLLKGFGASMQKKILEEIEKIKLYEKFILLDTAEKYSNEILQKLSQLSSVSQIAITGQLRRGMEIISKLEFIILTKNADFTCSQMQNLFHCTMDEKCFKVINEFSIPVYLYYVETNEEFNSKLFFTTGSEEFISKLNLIEKVNSSAKSENEIFAKVNLPFIIPEMREKEYFSICKKELKGNSNLAFNQFNGLLHFHTTYSDGRDTLFVMLQESEKMGFKYASVCDHSKSAYYANGLNEERILFQKQEITDFTQENKLHCFQGVETDILSNGDLDYSNDFLRNIDFVIASVHSAFNMEQDKMTSRIIKAIENPNTDVLGHPTGRLLLSRPPYQVNIKKIIDACAQNQVAIEINANPHRLDLDWRLIFYAREKGCLFAINPDAHSLDEIRYIQFGIMVARKAGIQSEEVINCLDLASFKKFLSRKIKRNFNGLS